VKNIIRFIKKWYVYSNKFRRETKTLKDWIKYNVNIDDSSTEDTYNIEAAIEFLNEKGILNYSNFCSITDALAYLFSDGEIMMIAIEKVGNWVACRTDFKLARE
jgi:hypothetical protein